MKTPYFGSSVSFKVIDVDTTEKLVTSACCDGQLRLPMVICNRFHERLANSSKTTTFKGVPLFDALDHAHVSFNLENRDLDR